MEVNNQTTTSQNVDQSVQQTNQSQVVDKPPAYVNQDGDVNTPASNVQDHSQEDTIIIEHKNIVLYTGIVFFITSLLITLYFLFFKNFVLKFLNI